MPNILESRATASPSPARTATAFYGISLRISLAVLATAVLLGFIISIGDQTISSAVLVINIIAALVVTLISHPRNLYIVVCCAPISLGLNLILAGWLTAHANGNTGMGLAQLVTAIYPVTQYFPQLFLLTIGCIAIACIRLYLLRRRVHRTSREVHKQRAKQQIREQRNRQASAKSRRQASNAANQVTVQDLLERRKAQRSQQQRPGQSGSTRSTQRSGRQDGGARTYARRSAEQPTNSARRSAANRQGSDDQQPRTQQFQRPTETRSQRTPATQAQRIARPERQQSTQRAQDHRDTQVRDTSSRDTTADTYNRSRRTSAHDRQNPTSGQVPRPRRGEARSTRNRDRT